MATKTKQKANGQTTAAAVNESIPVIADYDWSLPIQSPLKLYPGAVVFPEHFNMHHYRAWIEVNSKLQAVDDEEQGKYRMLTIGYSNGRKPQLADSREWAHVLSVASIQLDNLPKAALKDDSGESTPFEVLAWLIPLANIYLNEKLNLKN